MRVLVTGGAGFIGSHLCEALLARGDEVTVLDNLFTSHRSNIEHLRDHRRFAFDRADVCDPFHFEVDAIYHLACPASPVHYQRNPVRTVKTAILGTMHALELARDTGAKLLIASTSEVYGDPLVHPQPETYVGNVNPIGPRACYDEGKRAGEALAASWMAQYGTDVRIARIFNTYGPRMARNDGRLIPNFVTQALEQRPMTIYGSGEQTRSLCYVSDTVSGLMTLMDEPLKVPFPVNIGNPDERTVRDIASDVWQAVNPDMAPQFEQRPLPADDPMQRCPDITCAKALGWTPKVPYALGLRETVRWFREGA